MKKVYKYGTGHPIPEGAEYLSTIVGTTIETDMQNSEEAWRDSTALLVWHYFLVEVKDKK